GPYAAGVKAYALANNVGYIGALELMGGINGWSSWCTNGVLGCTAVNPSPGYYDGVHWNENGAELYMDARLTYFGITPPRMGYASSWPANCSTYTAASPLAYNAGTTYPACTYATYLGVYYISLVGSNTGNTPNSKTKFWKALQLGGKVTETGFNGPGVGMLDPVTGTWGPINGGHNLADQFGAATGTSLYATGIIDGKSTMNVSTTTPCT